MRVIDLFLVLLILQTSQLSETSTLCRAAVRAAGVAYCGNIARLEMDPNNTADNNTDQISAINGVALHRPGHSASTIITCSC